jgi:hypothetical protein
MTWTGRVVQALIVGCGVLMAFGASSPARADDLFTWHPMERTPTVSAEPMHLATFADDKRWTAEVLATGLADVTNRNVGMAGGTVGIGYYVFTNLAIMLDFSGYWYTQPDDSGSAAGMTIGLRHHWFNVGKASIFADVSYGIIETEHAVPHGGTHFNNTFEFGPAVAYPLRENFYLITGVRYFHLSNAESEGSRHNPSVNAIQGVVGVAWRF